MTPGTQVIIRTGAHGGTKGEVVSIERGISGRDIVNVRLTVPELLMDPTGPTRVVVLPYAPAELHTEHVVSDTDECWCKPTVVAVP